GHYDLQFAVLPPLMIDGGLRLATGRISARRGGIWLGLLVTAQLFITEEILAVTAIAGAVMVAVLAASRPRAGRGPAGGGRPRRRGRGDPRDRRLSALRAVLRTAATARQPVHGRLLQERPVHVRGALVAPALPHARQRGRGAAVPGRTARVPRLPRLAADRAAGPGRDRLLAPAAGPDGRGGLRRSRRVLARRHADVRRARAPRDQAALVLAAE